MPYLPINAGKKAEIDAVVAEVARELAPSVVFIRYDIEKDWSGDWALFFRILLSDAATRGRRLSRITSQVKKLLRERLNPDELDVLVYFTFRSQSEQAELREKAWA